MFTDSLKEELDALPSLLGSSRTSKIGSLCCICSTVLTGIVAGVWLLEGATKSHLRPTTSKDRQEWFLAGAHGLPPGFCEEHAMTLPPDLSINHKDWAASIVSKMTEEEKYRMIMGVGFAGFKAKKGYYIGSVLGVPRLGVPCIKMQDGCAGFRTTDEEMLGTVTSWPSPLSLAATWDADLVEDWAAAMGDEFRAKGANMILAPAVNVHRSPFGGRNAEYLSGEDPTLGRLLAPAFVRGMQDRAGVAVAVKHFAMNEQEYGRSSMNSIAEARTRWEHYYPPFEAAIRAGAAAVMCSYNKVNGKQACSNGDILIDDLKQGMGFSGFVLSDWWAIRDDEAAAEGTDMDMPGNDKMFSKPKLENAVPELRRDEMVERILIGMSRSGAWSNLPADDCRVGCNCAEKLYHAVATSPSHVDLARKLAARGAVLLKNDAVGPDSRSQPVLPIAAGKKIALLGGACGWKPDVHHEMKEWTEASYYTIGGTSRVLSPDTVTLAEALKQSNADVEFSNNDFATSARKAIAGADVAVVCTGSTSTESVDRSHLRVDQDAFVGQVVLMGKQMKVPVVVVVYAPGAVVLPWSGDATGLLLMFPSGQATGWGAADLLLGRAQPSGKLPVTIPLSEEDALPPCKQEKCEYKEKLFGGWHMYRGRSVAFPFGFGLTYTKFEYSPGDMSDVSESASRTLSVQVRNVGDAAGSDIVQLYLRYPSTIPEIAEEPETQLRRFLRTRELQPGEAQTLIFKLGARDEMIWDPSMRSWTMVYGEFTVGIGHSSRELRLCGAFNNERAVVKTDAVPLAHCNTRLRLPSADVA